MSKTKGLTVRYRFGNKTKTFWYLSRICLNENRLFRFVPESPFLDQIEIISFDNTNSWTNSEVLVSFLLDIGTWNVYGMFVPLLFWRYILLCTMSWVCSFPRPGKSSLFSSKTSFFILLSIDRFYIEIFMFRVVPGFASRGLPFCWEQYLSHPWSRQLDELNLKEQWIY